MILVRHEPRLASLAAPADPEPDRLVCGLLAHAATCLSRSSGWRIWRGAAEAQSSVERAIALRRVINDQERIREDVAVELAYALYLGSEIATPAEGRSATYSGEIIDILTGFDAACVLSPCGLHCSSRRARRAGDHRPRQVTARFTWTSDHHLPTESVAY
jgi:hypothetical protein